MILMRQSLNRESLEKISYLVGSLKTVSMLGEISPREPFHDEVLDFLNELSKTLMKNPKSRLYSDVVTFAFWIRKTSLLLLKNKHSRQDGNIRLGRGTAFHIAPSNVPVNFAYSLVAGLLMGNSNIVRIPSREFPQIGIIIDGIHETLKRYERISPYIVLVRYGKNKDVNDLLSAIADIRIVWGGDETIAELRKSELPPRSTEITFADRYSIAVINSEIYLASDNKKKIAEDFYNDTYFSDQNACTSPGIVVWTGKEKNKAKKQFWDELHCLVKQKYTFQDIQGVNKLTSSYLAAVAELGVKMEQHHDNLIIRAVVQKITERLMDLKDNSGFFFEYDCDDLLDLKPLCDDKRCQTLGLLGDKEKLIPLLTSGIRGVDRVVPIGKTMDFELIWDGYDLYSQLTRVIRL